jgi:acetyl-CoA carboxylase biotin carboxylase subunit
VPSGPGVRDDSGVYEGAEVPLHYDPLISKLIAWGADRTEALGRLERALAEYTVAGIKTTLPFFRRLVRDPEFRRGEFDTGFVDRLLARPAPAHERPWEAAVAAAAIEALESRRAARPDAAAADRASAWRAQGWRDARRGW